MAALHWTQVSKDATLRHIWRQDVAQIVFGDCQRRLGEVHLCANSGYNPAFSMPMSPGREGHAARWSCLALVCSRLGSAPNQTFDFGSTLNGLETHPISMLPAENNQAHF